jgi:hypothetical protein
MDKRHFVMLFSLLGLLTVSSCSSDKAPTNVQTTPVTSQAQPQDDAHESAEIELGVVMGHIQRYTDKLYFAGLHQNWPLANFYLHELEETTESIIGANVVDDGINVSDLMKTMLEPKIEALEAKVKAKDAAGFKADYQLLVNTCNACHAASQHPFIQIIVPEEPTYKNQQFKP